MTDLEKAKQLDWEIQCYGMTEASVKHLIETQAFPGTEMMFAAGMLSDAHPIMEPECSDEAWVNPETANKARQYINIAKYIMFKTMKED